MKRNLVPSWRLTLSQLIRKLMFRITSTDGLHIVACFNMNYTCNGCFIYLHTSVGFQDSEYSRLSRCEVPYQAWRALLHARYVQLGKPWPSYLTWNMRGEDYEHIKSIRALDTWDIVPLQNWANQFTFVCNNDIDQIDLHLVLRSHLDWGIFSLSPIWFCMRFEWILVPMDIRGSNVCLHQRQNDLAVWWESNRKRRSCLWLCSMSRSFSQASFTEWSLLKSCSSSLFLGRWSWQVHCTTLN